MPYIRARSAFALNHKVRQRLKKLLARSRIIAKTDCFEFSADLQTEHLFVREGLKPQVKGTSVECGDFLSEPIK